VMGSKNVLGRVLAKVAKKGPEKVPAKLSKTEKKKIPAKVLKTGEKKALTMDS